ncbi:hypothetical protein HOM50_01895 [bacterium]|nr:hypothetical protein [bacterium]MBT5015140.1 hypothetical protein [bacterium]
MKISKITVLLLSGLAVGNMSAVSIPGAALLSSLTCGHSKKETAGILAGSAYGLYRIGTNEELREHLMENKAEATKKIGLGFLSFAGICTLAKHAHAAAPNGGVVGNTLQTGISAAKYGAMGWAGYRLLKGLETVESVREVRVEVGDATVDVQNLIDLLRAQEGHSVVESLQTKKADGSE